jgi:type II secretory pathway pseudopilin PulG
MMKQALKAEGAPRQIRNHIAGFTVVEVILAGSIMIILCVGTLSVYSYAVKINLGNNVRSQAQSVLQKQIELYRSAKFVPNHTDNILLAANNPQTSTVDSLPGDPRNIKFDVTVNIDNTPYAAGVPTAEVDGSGNPYLFKEININVVPHEAGLRQGWLANIGATVTFQRVRSN